MTDATAKNARLGRGEFLLLLAQLALLSLAAYALRIEERQGLSLILLPLFAGFAIHAWLPLAARPAFFLGVSLVSILVVLGFAGGAMLIAFGGLLFAACHLPKPWRFIAPVALTALFAAMRAGLVPIDALRDFNETALALLAAMFMFRIIVYLHDIEHQRSVAPLSQRLGYFFMIPNVCFPLFPVIDYRNYLREYYSAPAVEMYQKGMRWIARGFVHLLIYRVVYYHLMPSFDQVTGFWTVMQYIVATYLLYLRVSGLFHVAIGVLCLFGYNLPETHRLYFLSSSFTDFWRRINIYWKDFITKIFYYPLFMRLRGMGMAPAVMVASVATLIVSWMFHSYQTFWLKGEFPITIQDGVFWTVLGFAVAFNSVLELRSGRARAMSTDERTFSSALTLSAKTVGMFCIMTVLWSFWSTSALDEWFAMAAIASRASAGQLLALSGIILGAIALGTAAQLTLKRGWVLSREKSPSFGRAAANTIALALAGLLISIEPLGQRLPEGMQEVWISVAGRNRLNVREQENETRGYYEDLLGAGSARPAEWSQEGRTLAKRYAAMVGIGGLPDVVQPTGDIRRYELRASMEVSYGGVDLHTNRWGMRDKDYEKQKAPGTCRLLVFGDSHTMGSSVGDEETYEAILEQRLNSERPIAHCRSWEVLNFGVAGYSALQTAGQVRLRAPEFAPDVVIYATAQPELHWAVSLLSRALAEGDVPDEPYLRDLIRRIGAEGVTNEYKIRQLLAPVSAELVTWAYRTISEASTEAGARAVWLFLPRLDRSDAQEAERYRELSTLAQNAGFELMSLNGIYDGYDHDSLMIGVWDVHPNAKANELIGSALYDRLVDEADRLLPPPAAAAPPPP